MDMRPGNYMLKGCRNKNRKRLFHSQYRSKEPNKKRRKIIRGEKKKKADEDKAKEGKLYKAGYFN